MQQEQQQQAPESPCLKPPPAGASSSSTPSPKMSPMTPKRLLTTSSEGSAHVSSGCESDETPGGNICEIDSSAAMAAFRAQKSAPSLGRFESASSSDPKTNDSLAADAIFFGLDTPGCPGAGPGGNSSGSGGTAPAVFFPPGSSSVINVNQQSSPSSSQMASSPSSTASPGPALACATPPAGTAASGSSSATPLRSSVDRKTSYKAQRKSYAREKKRVERELLSTFRDQSIIVLADWLKVRGSLKRWTKLWCVLKPGLLLIYRSQKAKSNHWIGTIILSTCELMERPSKKDGFCFKLFHPMDQSIWASKGPEGETLGAVVQPLPTSHLIFRAPNNAAGKCWMDALDLALRCSSLLLRSMGSKNASTGQFLAELSESGVLPEEGQGHSQPLMTASTGIVESDADNHSMSEVDGDHSGCEREIRPRRSGNSTSSSIGDAKCKQPPTTDEEEELEEDDEEMEDEDSGAEGSDYSFDCEGSMNKEPMEEYVASMYEADPNFEVFGTAGDQTEEFSEENKSIVWFLVKQVRPGMDLSKVVLPTFILEPRSFLDKLTDYHYHNDFLAQAVKAESPLARMKLIVKWYLSGFYKKPKGLKKPYNPILGETFRCCWEHPNGSRTFYIAEQVSHHPPISAFYVTNRREGFVISSSILAKSKFYGNSTSAILDGTATLTLLPRGEEYKLTMPYAHCKGILMGTLTMELGGKVLIECSKTGYSTEMEFKLRPFLGGGEFTNAVSGRIRLGKETLMTLDGHWDDQVILKDKANGDEIFWKVTPEIRSARLKRFTIPLGDQGEFESVRLWQKVSRAIERDDQQAATEEKFILEEAQRAGARERKATGQEWVPKYFELNPSTNQYEYKHSDLRPWDPNNDMLQYESDFIVRTKTKHKTPMIRTQSIVSVSEAGKVGHEKSSTKATTRRRLVAKKAKACANTDGNQTGSSEDKADGLEMKEASPSKLGLNSEEATTASVQSLERCLAPLEDQLRQSNERLVRLQQTIEVMQYQQRERDGNSNINRDLILLVMLVVMIQAVLNWVLTHRASQYSGGGEFHPADEPGA